MMSFPLNRCNECSNILLSGTYKPGKQPNTFVCKSHQSTHKAPPTQATPPARAYQPTPIITKSPPTPQDITLRSAGKDPAQPKPGSLWITSKKESSSAPTPTPTPAPTAAPRYRPTSTISVAASAKSPAEQKVLSETPKGPSSSVLRNQEARQR